ncbi:preprotein translocase subunit YajC [Coxiella endosymbiont of Amblyomma sculptum]|uniref:preprotein translocase subunit YajC n=1 Tax=Coxiella endosymbiont of Amblyomma sculptum TaxID=2487929 RepID=UPI00132F0E22|nr:preprotein translocase subunit YajC [Coxiella endosymbiont of Amblyomma sculptum]QHG92587.1 preprotein translocase subunit YajC [Coxiella endosymbiont of Amblyomma sculptum]
MNFANLLGVDAIYAMSSVSDPQPSRPTSFWSMLWLPLLLILIFYLLLIRPQAKRAKEHKQLLEKIAPRDEVVTTGGILGRVTRLKGNVVILEIAKNIEITVQKGSIASVLPKDTIDSMSKM